MDTIFSLSYLRNQINNIDKKIVQLLSKRKKFILSIARYKIKNKKEIRDIEREKKMLKYLIYLGKEYDLNDQYITHIFQIIIRESVLSQYTLLQNFYNYNQNQVVKFAFLGPDGSYSHLAVRQYINKNSKKNIEKSFSTFQETIISVENNETDYAMIPIENNSSGPIDEILDLLIKTNLFIIGEINIDINHCLLASKKTQLKDIKKIYSHSQPFKQCSKFLSQFSHCQIKYTTSTTNAMQKIANDNKIHYAALGSEIGSKIYKLNILASNISNQEKNITRFILLAKNKILVSPNIPAKTTLIFSIRKKSKDIINISSILHKKNLIMKIISIKQNKNNIQEKLVYIDIPLNMSSSCMQDIIKQIKNNSNFIKILGCYPNEKIIDTAI